MKWVDPSVPAGGTGGKPGPAQGGAAPQRANREAYAMWADLSEFRGYTNVAFFVRHDKRPVAKGIRPGDFVSVIAKAKQGQQRQAIDAVDKMGFVPSVYLKSIPGTVVQACHFTARVRRRDLQALARLDGIERWELGLPVATPDDRQRGNGAQADAANERRLPSVGDRGRQVIAVIDYGCAVLQRCFGTGDPLHTRLLHYWEQGNPIKKKPFRAPTGFGYGRMLDRDDIELLLAKRKEAFAKHRGSDETESYRDLRLLHLRGDPSLPVRATAHGTHVLDVAGGRIDPWTGGSDNASEAELVFIELPFNTAADGSGGSLSVHLLDGLRDILRVSRSDAAVMVSISQGTHAGPHDGSSLIEQAMDELLELRRHDFCIVVGAGNARHMQCHAHTVVQPRETVSLTLSVPERDSTDSFVECWYPRHVEGVDSALEVTVRAPGADATSALAGQTRALEHPPRAAKAKAPAKRVAALIHRSAVDTGRDAMALLALGPAEAGASVASAGVPAGLWQLQLRNLGKHALPVSCYVERDEPVRPPRQQFPKFLDRATAASVGRHVAPSETGTLNTLATGRHTIVAHACFRHTGTASPYSSIGPVRGGARGPGYALDVWAAADENPFLPGVRAAAVRSGSSFRMNGTSVAAPTLARLLFNALVDRRQAGGGVQREQWAEVIDQLASAAGTPDRVFRQPRRPGQSTGGAAAGLTGTGSSTGRRGALRTAGSA